MLTAIESLPMWMLGLVFSIAAGAVWLAGTRLARYVDGISEKTGLGRAFTGMLLLGGITSLPEVAAVSTSAAVGDAPLAVNNLLGTASINLMLLAFADIFYGRDALTSAAATPATLMQGVLSMLLASGVAMIATIGDIAILGVGVGSATLAFGCVAALWISANFETRNVWEVVGRPPLAESLRSGSKSDEKEEAGANPGEDSSLRTLILATAVTAAVILAGGFFLSVSAGAIAARTGIASGMIGFLLVGLSTSLPELSSVVAAVRLRRYDMAVGDIFGTNLFNIALITLADAFYRGEPVLTLAGRFETIGALLAVLLTGIFIVGLLERWNRTILRMGVDASAAVLVFGGGIVLLARVSG
jgi:cation:H+ antiporter